MTAGRMGMRHTGRRRVAAAAVAAAGVWGASLIGLAPAASAQDAASQWYLDSMQAEKMWEVSKGEGVTVAVIDSGVGDTPALQGQVLSGTDASSLPGGPRSDTSGHGTTMAELIAGSGERSGIQGLAPSAKILPIRVTLGEKAGQQVWVDPRELAEAIRAAADSDARIISMSLGGNYYDSYAEKAIKYASSKGKLIFASTGNDGSAKPSYPVNFPEVVGVGAVDTTGSHAKFSSYGKTVDLAAPGTEIPTYCDKSLARYCTSEGTSQATAIASASAALIWAEHPDWTANQVLNVLIDTAGRSDGKQALSKYIGWGVVKPRANLLEGQGDPGAPDENPLVPAGTESEKPGAEPTDQASDDAKAEATEAAGAEADAGDDNGELWTVLGVAVLAAGAVGGGAYALIRRRSTT